MFFSRITPRPDAGKNSAFWKLAGDAYQAHRLVWSLFADDPYRERDFLYRWENAREGSFCLYTVSARPPEDRHGVFRVEPKEYKPRLAKGTRLAFKLRANPIRSKRDVQGRQSRHDVVMDAKHKNRAENPENPLPSMAEIVQTTGLQWLKDRAVKHGFAIDPHSVRADGYRQHRFNKRPKSRTVSLSTIDFDGLMTVETPEDLVQALYNGVGPAKSFGCGLLMVRRAS